MFNWKKQSIRYELKKPALLFIIIGCKAPLTFHFGELSSEHFLWTLLANSGWCLELESYTYTFLCKNYHPSFKLLGSAKCAKNIAHFSKVLLCSRPQITSSAQAPVSPGGRGRAVSSDITHCSAPQCARWTPGFPLPWAVTLDHGQIIDFS